MKIGSNGTFAVRSLEVMVLAAAIEILLWSPGQKVSCMVPIVENENLASYCSGAGINVCEGTKLANFPKFYTLDEKWQSLDSMDPRLKGRMCLYWQESAGEF